MEKAYYIQYGPPSSSSVTSNPRRYVYTQNTLSATVCFQLSHPVVYSIEASSFEVCLRSVTKTTTIQCQRTKIFGEDLYIPFFVKKNLLYTRLGFERV